MSKQEYDIASKILNFKLMFLLHFSWYCVLVLFLTSTKKKNLKKVPKRMQVSRVVTTWLLDQNTKYNSSYMMNIKQNLYW